MKLFPNCKINIGLRVVRKREDGYHDLETIFYPVYGLHDELEVEEVNDIENQGYTFIQEGLAVDCQAEDNLIIKCYLRMKDKYSQIKGVRIKFKKNIPFGAGLGGGSSDAAHMAIALNEIFHLGLNREQLAHEVRPLGADCPFFIYNTPCYAEGIGDQLTPIPLDLSNLRLVMIKPQCGVSTREAYSGIRLSDPSDMPNLSDTSDLAALLNHATNDFEHTVFALHPELADIKKRLLDAGAIYAAMSGSGSTIFGLFPTLNCQLNPEGRTDAQLRLLHEEFASMIIFDDTLCEAQS